MKRRTSLLVAFVAACSFTIARTEDESGASAENNESVPTLEEQAQDQGMHIELPYLKSDDNSTSDSTSADELGGVDLSNNGVAVGDQSVEQGEKIVDLSQYKHVERFCNYINMQPKSVVEQLKRPGLVDDDFPHSKEDIEVFTAFAREELHPIVFGDEITKARCIECLGNRLKELELEEEKLKKADLEKADLNQVAEDAANNPEVKNLFTGSSDESAEQSTDE